MFCGSVDLTKLQSREILNLLLLSSYEFELQPSYIQETLIKNHNDFIMNKLWDFCIQELI